MYYGWRKHIWFKIVALAVAGVFLVSDISWAARTEGRYVSSPVTSQKQPYQPYQGGLKQQFNDIMQGISSFLLPTAHAAEKPKVVEPVKEKREKTTISAYVQSFHGKAQKGHDQTKLTGMPELTADNPTTTTATNVTTTSTAQTESTAVVTTESTKASTKTDRISDDTTDTVQADNATNKVATTSTSTVISAQATGKQSQQPTQNQPTTDNVATTANQVNQTQAKNVQTVTAAVTNNKATGTVAANDITPTISSEQVTDYGPAPPQGTYVVNCAVEAIHIYRTDLSLQQIAKLAVDNNLIDKDGFTSLEQLKTLASLLGVDFKAVKADLNDLNNLKEGAIAYVTKNGAGHWVSDLKRTGDTVTYMDNGTQVTESVAEFSKKFGGYLLTKEEGVGAAVSSAEAQSVKGAWSLNDIWNAGKAIVSGICNVVSSIGAAVSSAVSRGVSKARQYVSKVYNGYKTVRKIVSNPSSIIRNTVNIVRNTISSFIVIPMHKDFSRAGFFQDPLNALKGPNPTWPGILLGRVFNDGCHLSWYSPTGDANKPTYTGQSVLEFLSGQKDWGRDFWTNYDNAMRAHKGGMDISGIWNEMGDAKDDMGLAQWIPQCSALLFASQAQDKGGKVDVSKNSNGGITLAISSPEGVDIYSSTQFSNGKAVHMELDFKNRISQADYNQHIKSVNVASPEGLNSVTQYLQETDNMPAYISFTDTESNVTVIPVHKMKEGTWEVRVPKVSEIAQSSVNLLLLSMFAPSLTEVQKQGCVDNTIAPGESVFSLSAGDVITSEVKDTRTTVNVVSSSSEHKIAIKRTKRSEGNYHDQAVFYYRSKVKDNDGNAILMVGYTEYDLSGSKYACTNPYLYDLLQFKTKGDSIVAITGSGSGEDPQKEVINNILAKINDVLDETKTEYIRNQYKNTNAFSKENYLSRSYIQGAWRLPKSLPDCTNLDVMRNGTNWDIKLNGSTVLTNGLIVNPDGSYAGMITVIGDNKQRNIVYCIPGSILGQSVAFSNDAQHISVKHGKMTVEGESEEEPFTQTFEYTGATWDKAWDSMNQTQEDYQADVQGFFAWLNRPAKDWQDAAMKIVSMTPPGMLLQLESKGLAYCDDYVGEFLSGFDQGKSWKLTSQTEGADNKVVKLHTDSKKNDYYTYDEPGLSGKLSAAFGSPVMQGSYQIMASNRIRLNADGTVSNIETLDELYQAWQAMPDGTIEKAAMANYLHARSWSQIGYGEIDWTKDWGNIGSQILAFTGWQICNALKLAAGDTCQKVFEGTGTYLNAHADQLNNETVKQAETAGQEMSYASFPIVKGVFMAYNNQTGRTAKWNEYAQSTLVNSINAAQPQSGSAPLQASAYRSNYTVTDLIMDIVTVVVTAATLGAAAPEVVSAALAARAAGFAALKQAVFSAFAYGLGSSAAVLNSLGVYTASFLGFTTRMLIRAAAYFVFKQAPELVLRGAVYVTKMVARGVARVLFGPSFVTDFNAANGLAKLKPIANGILHLIGLGDEGFNSLIYKLAGSPEKGMLAAIKDGVWAKVVNLTGALIGHTILTTSAYILDCYDSNKPWDLGEWGSWMINKINQTQNGNEQIQRTIGLFLNIVIFGNLFNSFCSTIAGPVKGASLTESIRNYAKGTWEKGKNGEWSLKVKDNATWSTQRLVVNVGQRLRYANWKGIVMPWSDDMAAIRKTMVEKGLASSVKDISVRQVLSYVLRDNWRFSILKAWKAVFPYSAMPKAIFVVRTIVYTYMFTNVVLGIKNWIVGAKAHFEKIMVGGVDICEVLGFQFFSPDYTSEDKNWDFWHFIAHMALGKDGYYDALVAQLQEKYGVLGSQRAIEALNQERSTLERGFIYNTMVDSQMWSFAIGVGVAWPILRPVVLRIPFLGPTVSTLARCTSIGGGGSVTGWVQSKIEGHSTWSVIVEGLLKLIKAPCLRAVSFVYEENIQELLPDILFGRMLPEGSFAKEILAELFDRTPDGMMSREGKKAMAEFFDSLRQQMNSGSSQNNNDPAVRISFEGSNGDIRITDMNSLQNAEKAARETGASSITITRKVTMRGEKQGDQDVQKQKNYSLSIKTSSLSQLIKILSLANSRSAIDKALEDIEADGVGYASKDPSNTLGQAIVELLNSQEMTKGVSQLGMILGVMPFSVEALGNLNLDPDNADAVDNFLTFLGVDPNDDAAKNKVLNKMAAAGLYDQEKSTFTAEGVKLLRLAQKAVNNGAYIFVLFKEVEKIFETGLAKDLNDATGWFARFMVKQRSFNAQLLQNVRQVLEIGSLMPAWDGTFRLAQALQMALTIYELNKNTTNNPSTNEFDKWVRAMIKAGGNLAKDFTTYDDLVKEWKTNAQDDKGKKYEEVRELMMKLGLINKNEEITNLGYTFLVWMLGKTGMFGINADVLIQMINMCRFITAIKNGKQVIVFPADVTFAALVKEINDKAKIDETSGKGKTIIVVDGSVPKNPEAAEAKKKEMVEALNKNRDEKNQLKVDAVVVVFIPGLTAKMLMLSDYNGKIGLSGQFNGKRFLHTYDTDNLNVYADQYAFAIDMPVSDHEMSHLNGLSRANGDESKLSIVSVDELRAREKNAAALEKAKAQYKYADLFSRVFIVAGHEIIHNNGIVEHCFSKDCIMYQSRPGDLAGVVRKGSGSFLCSGCQTKLSAAFEKSEIARIIDALNAAETPTDSKRDGRQQTTVAAVQNSKIDSSKEINDFTTSRDGEQSSGSVGEGISDDPKQEIKVEHSDLPPPQRSAHPFSFPPFVFIGSILQAAAPWIEVLKRQKKDAKKQAKAAANAVGLTPEQYKSILKILSDCKGQVADLDLDKISSSINTLQSAAIASVETKINHKISATVISVVVSMALLIAQTILTTGPPAVAVWTLSVVISIFFAVPFISASRSETKEVKLHHKTNFFAAALNIICVIAIAVIPFIPANAGMLFKSAYAGSSYFSVFASLHKPALKLRKRMAKQPKRGAVVGGVMKVYRASSAAARILAKRAGEQETLRAGLEYIVRNYHSVTLTQLKTTEFEPSSNKSISTVAGVMAFVEAAARYILLQGVPSTVAGVGRSAVQFINRSTNQGGVSWSRSLTKSFVSTTLSSLAKRTQLSQLRAREGAKRVFSSPLAKKAVSIRATALSQAGNCWEMMKARSSALRSEARSRIAGSPFISSIALQMEWLAASPSLKRAALLALTVLATVKGAAAEELSAREMGMDNVEYSMDGSAWLIIGVVFAVVIVGAFVLAKYWANSDSSYSTRSRTGLSGSSRGYNASRSNGIGAVGVIIIAVKIVAIPLRLVINLVKYSSGKQSNNKGLGRASRNQEEDDEFDFIDCRDGGRLHTLKDLALASAKLPTVAGKVVFDCLVRALNFTQHSGPTVAGDVRRAAFDDIKELLADLHTSGVDLTRRATQLLKSSEFDYELPSEPGVVELIKNTDSGFPKLDVKKVVADENRHYNCIASSVGIDNAWIWPGKSVKRFDRFYADHGFQRVVDRNEADIAVFTKRWNKPTHAARRITEDVWESKLGSSYTILHALGELEGPKYGKAKRFYARNDSQRDGGMDVNSWVKVKRVVRKIYGAVVGMFSRQRVVKAFQQAGALLTSAPVFTYAILLGASVGAAFIGIPLLLYVPALIGSVAGLALNVRRVLAGEKAQFTFGVKAGSIFEALAINQLFGKEAAAKTEAVKTNRNLAVGLAIAGAVIAAVCLPVQWLVFAAIFGAVAGYYFPSILRVTENFFIGAAKRNEQRSNFAQDEEVRKQAQQLAADYKVRYEQASVLGKAYYFATGAWAKFSLQNPVIAGTISFLVMRVTLAVIGLYFADALLVSLVPSSVANFSVLSLGWTGLADFLSYIGLPHTVAGLTRVFFVTLGLSFLRYARYSKALYAVNNNLAVSLVSALGLTVLAPVGFIAGAFGANPYSQLISKSSREFWTSFVGMWLIGAQIGVIMQLGAGIGSVEQFGIAGDLVQATVGIFEQQATSFGSQAVNQTVAADDTQAKANELLQDSDTMDQPVIKDQVIDGQGHITKVVYADDSYVVYDYSTNTHADVYKYNTQDQLVDQAEADFVPVYIVSEAYWNADHTQIIYPREYWATRIEWTTKTETFSYNEDVYSGAFVNYGEYTKSIYESDAAGKDVLVAEETYDQHSNPNQLIESKIYDTLTGKVAWTIEYPEQVSLATATGDTKALPKQVSQAWQQAGIKESTMLQPATITDASGATWTEYRIANDPAARKIFEDRQDYNVFSTSWNEGNGEPVFSYKTTEDNQVMATLEAQDAVSGKDIQAMMDRETGFIFTKTTAELLKEQLGIDINDALKVMGVQDATQISVVKETPFIRETAATGEVVYSDRQATPTTHYMMPNDPLGRDIITVYPDKNTVISAWYEARAGPAGVLPQAITVREDGTIGEVKTYTGEDSVNGVQCHVYTVANSETKAAEYRTNDNQLYRADYDRIVLSLANVYDVTAGKEIVYYDLSKSNEAPLYATNEKGAVIKEWVSTTYDNEQGVEIQVVREEDPLVPGKWNIYEYKHDLYTGDLLAKNQLDLFKDLFYQVGPLQVWAWFVLGTAGFLLGIPAFLKKIFQRAPVINRFQPRQVKTSTHKDHETLPTRQDVESAAENYGFDAEQIRAAAYLIPDIFEGSSRSSEDILAGQFESFKDWMDDNNLHGWLDEQGLELNYDLNDMVLFRLVFLSSTHMRSITPGWRYYLFLRALAMQAQGVEGVGAQIVALADYWYLNMKKFYTGKQYDGMTKEKRMTYEDVEDIFNGRGKDKDFVRKLLDKGNDEDILKAWAADPKAHKTYRDQFGWRGVLALGKTCWIFVAGMAASFVGLIALAALPAFAPVLLAGMAIAAGCLIGYAVYQPNRAFKLILKNNPQIDSKAATYLKKLMFKQNVSAISFWTLVFGSKFAFNFAFFSWVMTMSTTIGGFGLAAFWTTAWVTGLWLPFVLFFILDTFTFYYLWQFVFSQVKGYSLGLGRITGWKQLKNAAPKALEAYMNTMGIPEDMRKDVSSALLTALASELRIKALLTEEECIRLAQGDFSVSPKNKQASSRIVYFFNTLLMEMPYAGDWDDVPSLSVAITAAGEKVKAHLNADPRKSAKELAEQTDVLNEVQEGVGLTKLTHLIRQTPDEWLNFIKQLRRIYTVSISEAQYSAWEALSGEEQFDFSIDSSVSSEIQAAVEEAVENWANLRFQAVYRTVHGLVNIWKAYEFLVKNVYFPDRADDEEFVRTQVARKLQLVLAYQNFGKIAADDLRREDIEALQKQYKCFDVVYLDEKKNVLQAVRGEYSASAEHGIHPQYKPMNQNNFATWLTNDKVLLFDANCDMRLEDALKLPNLLMEFNLDRLLKGINLPEYIFTEDFNWIGQAHGFGDRTWTTFVQRFLAMYGADGFYGHGAVFDRDVIQEFGVLSPDYVSEDLMMAMKVWLKGKGYRIEHKEYLQCGKAREVSVPASAIPFNKFAEGSAELFVGRQLKRLFASKEVTWYQKMFLFFTLGFYLRKPLVVLTMLAYISLVMVLGVSGFAGFPMLMTFGLLGILFSQVISFTGFGQIMLERGILKGALKFAVLFPKLLLIFPYYVMVYFKGVLGGFSGKAAFIVTKKSWEIEKSDFQAKIASLYDTKTKVVAVFLVAAAISCFLWQALPVIYSLLFMWMVFSWLFTPVISAPGVLPNSTGFAPSQYKRWVSLVVSYLKDEVYGMKFFKVYDAAIAVIGIVAIVAFGFPLTFALFLLPVSAFGVIGICLVGGSVYFAIKAVLGLSGKKEINPPAAASRDGGSYELIKLNGDMSVRERDLAYNFYDVDNAVISADKAFEKANSRQQRLCAFERFHRLDVRGDEPFSAVADNVYKIIAQLCVEAYPQCCYSAVGLLVDVFKGVDAMTVEPRLIGVRDINGQTKGFHFYSVVEDANGDRWLFDPTSEQFEGRHPVFEARDGGVALEVESLTTGWTRNWSRWVKKFVKRVFGAVVGMFSRSYRINGHMVWLAANIQVNPTVATLLTVEGIKRAEDEVLQDERMIGLPENYMEMIAIMERQKVIYNKNRMSTILFDTVRMVGKP